MKLLPLVAKVVGMKIPKSKLKPPRGFKVPDVTAFKEDMERLGEDIAEGFKERVIENIEENKFGYARSSFGLGQKGKQRARAIHKARTQAPRRAFRRNTRAKA